MSWRGGILSISSSRLVWWSCVACWRGYKNEVGNVGGERINDQAWALARVDFALTNSLILGSCSVPWLWL